VFVTLRAFVVCTQVLAAPAAVGTTRAPTGVREKSPAAENDFHGRGAFLIMNERLREADGLAATNPPDWSPRKR
jgi:hypothetical protein